MPNLDVPALRTPSVVWGAGGNGILPDAHYAASWPIGIPLPLDEATDLGRRYVESKDPDLLLELCRCFHPYLMKYVIMICRGHVPIIGVGAGKKAMRINKDVEPFIRYFLPKGEKPNRVNLAKVVRHFHLAFKDMDPGEVYDVLMEHLIATLNGYDPEYKAKVKLVVEAIERELPKQKQFSAADVSRYLEFDCIRHLRLLARSGFLQAVPGREEKGVSDYRRLETWPPCADFFRGTPIGVAYFVQRWFRYALQEWIYKRMRELESKEGVYSLEGWHQYQRDHHLQDRAARGNTGVETLRVRSGEEGFQSHKGHTVAANVDMIRKPLDVSEMDLDWVQQTNDVMFGDLTKADRVHFSSRPRRPEGTQSGCPGRQLHPI